MYSSIDSPDSIGEYEYRVLTIQEDDTNPHLYALTAVAYERSKFDFIEKEEALNSSSFSTLDDVPGAIPAYTDNTMSLSDGLVRKDGKVKAYLDITWKAAKKAAYYNVYLKKDSEAFKLVSERHTQLSYRVEDISSGSKYSVRLVPYNILGVSGAMVEYKGAYSASGFNTPPASVPGNMVSINMHKGEGVTSAQEAVEIAHVGYVPTDLDFKNYRLVYKVRSGNTYVDNVKDYTGNSTTIRITKPGESMVYLHTVDSIGVQSVPTGIPVNIKPLVLSNLKTQWQSASNKLAVTYDIKSHSYGVKNTQYKVTSTAAAVPSWEGAKVSNSVGLIQLSLVDIFGSKELNDTNISSYILPDASTSYRRSRFAKVYIKAADAIDQLSIYRTGSSTTTAAASTVVSYILPNVTKIGLARSDAGSNSLKCTLDLPSTYLCLPKKVDVKFYERVATKTITNTVFSGDTSVVLANLTEFPTTGGTCKYKTNSFTYTAISGYNTATGAGTLIGCAGIVSTIPIGSIITLDLTNKQVWEAGDSAIARTITTAAVSDATTVTLDSVTGLATAGYVKFVFTSGNEEKSIVSKYTGIAGSTITGLTGKTQSIVLPVGTRAYFYPLIKKTSATTATVAAAATVVPLVSTANFPQSGTCYYGATIITYTGKTTASLTGCTNTPAIPKGKTIVAWIRDKNITGSSTFNLVEEENSTNIVMNSSATTVYVNSKHALSANRPGRLWYACAKVVEAHGNNSYLATECSTGINLI